MNGDPQLLFHILKVKYLMNFYQAGFPEKNFLENIRKKVRFGGNYPLIFTLSDQSYDSKNFFFFKFRLYMTQICGVAKKS